VNRLTRACAGLCFAWTVIAAAAAIAAPAARVEPAHPEQRILVLVRLAPEHYRPSAESGGGYGDALSRSAQRRQAGRIAHGHGLTLVDDWPMPAIGLDCFIMGVPNGRSPEQSATEVARDPHVSFAEPMHLYHAQGRASPPAHIPNDPLFAAQPAAHAWRLADLHQIATGKGVSVAVIDGAIERAHPDLVGQIGWSQDFAPQASHGGELHGTGIAGVIAAREDNGLGIAGIAPRVRLMGLRACWQTAGAGTLCDTLSLAKALHFAIENRAQVINMSLSGPHDALLARLIDVGLARGATVVAAFDRAAADGGFPASNPGVIAVAEDRGPPPPPGVYTAPGEGVPTTAPGGHWQLVDGSSYAAAHVSGLAALLRERHAPTPLTFVAANTSAGAIDACATLVRAQPCDCACARPPKPDVER